MQNAISIYPIKQPFYHRPLKFLEQQLLNCLRVEGLLTEYDVKQILQLQKQNHLGLHRSITALGLVDEKRLTQVYSQLFDIPIYPLGRGISFSYKNAQLQFIAQTGEALPFDFENGKVQVLVKDPLCLFQLRLYHKITEQDVDVYILPSSNFDDVVKMEISLENEVEQNSDDYNEINHNQTDVASSQAPSIKYIDRMLFQAINQGCSDIHVVALTKGCVIRFRKLGVLSDYDHPQIALRSLVSRLKIMAELDIAETRIPQDGRIRLKHSGRNVDLRVSTSPHLSGEGVILRILDNDTGVKKLDQLGLSSHSIQEISDILSLSKGLFLVCGPTGSGKTTTLYSCLDQIKSPNLNIVTIEDPVEKRIDGIAQTQISPKIGLTFPTALRAILRQDPDVIMVGEIRDAETASIAIRSALTGHFVLGSLHTNTALEAIPRLVDMGIEPYLLAAALNGVMSQRLMRCEIEDDQDISKKKLTRKPISEVIKINNDLRDIIRSKSQTFNPDLWMESNDILSMKDDAQKLVDNGMAKEIDIIECLGAEE